MDVDELVKTVSERRGELSAGTDPEKLSAEDIMASVKQELGDDFDADALEDSSDDEDVVSQVGEAEPEADGGLTSHEVRTLATHSP